MFHNIIVNTLVLFPTSLEDLTDEDNEVRFIDLFVESIDLGKMGFEVYHTENVRPAYHPKELLKLYLYGYLNSIRSSSKLEQATKVNIEVMWLLKGLTPNHNTISNFRRDNPKAIKKLYKYILQTNSAFEIHPFTSDDFTNDDPFAKRILESGIRIV